jgi:hypothetical protein
MRFREEAVGAANKDVEPENVLGSSARPDQPEHSESEQKLGRWIGDGVCCLALIGCCLAVGLPRYLVGIDPGDEGFLAYGALRVLHGEMPNRDFWSLQPPLSFYSSATMFAVMGTSLASLRTLGLFLYISIPLLLFAVARQRAGRLASLAAAAPALILGVPRYGFAPFAVWHGIVASLMAAFCAMRAARTGSGRWAVATGFATATTILSRHDQGFYIALSILTYLLALRWSGDAAVSGRVPRLLRNWVVGAAAPLFLLAIWWFASGALPSMFRQLVVFPLTTYAKTSALPMPVFMPGQSARELLVVATFYLPPIVDALAGLWLVSAMIGRRFRVEHAHITFIVAWSAFFYCQVLTRSDLQHLLITLCPFFVVLAWGGSALTAGAVAAVRAKFGAGSFVSRATRPVLAGVMILLGAWVLTELSPVAMPGTAMPLTTLNLERGGVQLDEHLATRVEGIVKTIQEYSEPGSAILALPYAPMFYFLADRRNPTHWNYLWPGDQTAEDHQALIAQAKNDPPAVIALLGEDEMESYAGPILDYVRSGHRLVRDYGGLTLYVPDRGALQEVPGR